MEKGQEILNSLFVTPVRLREYLIAQVLSLTFLAVQASLILLIIPNGFRPLSTPFLLGVILGSALFTLVGLGVGARVNTLNGYLFGVMAGTMIFSLPLLGYLDIYDGLWLYLLPTRATLLLLMSTYDSLSAAQIIYALVCLGLWTILAWIFAVKSFEKFIIGGE